MWRGVCGSGKDDGSRMSEKRRWKSWQKRLRDSTINSEQVDLPGDVMGNTPGANGNVKALSGCTKI